MKKKKSFSIKNIILIYSILLLAVSVASLAVSVYFTRSVKKRSEAGDVKYDKYFVMISSDRDALAWQSIYEGALEEGAKHNVYVEYMGEKLSKNYTDTELMEIAIASKVDGIIVRGDESKEMDALIDQATAQGIPVVTVYEDNPNSSRCCYVGVGSFNMGREYGKQICKLARERELSNTTASTHMNDVLNVTVLVDSSSDSSNQNLVWSGIQNAVKTENTTETQINLELQYLDNSGTFAAEESIRDMLRSKDLADVIVCLNEINTNCVYQSMVDYNKVGKAAILGYSDSESVLKGINRNNIYFSVSVDTKKMGADCINALEEYFETGNTSQFILADITPIDKNTIYRYLDENGEVKSEDED